MPDVFFTSDLHFGHRKCAELRGFDSPDDHDDALVARWNDTVRPWDVVWVLGDVAVSSPTYALGRVRELHGEKHLIAGNHDQCHPMHRDAHRRLLQYVGPFASVASAARRRIEGREVLLSHFPYRRDRGPARHMQWRLRDEGLWLLHGHTHGAEQLVHASREVHVGLDAWDLSPVRIDTVAHLIEQSERAREGAWRLARNLPRIGAPG